MGKGHPFGKSPLSERALKWVERFLLHGDGKLASVEAGYQGDPFNRAKTLREDPRVRELLEKARTKAKETCVAAAAYNYAMAMAETEEALELARAKRSPGDMARLVELRAKLSGLLVEKSEKAVSFRIEISGIGETPRQVEEAVTAALVGRPEEE